MKICSKCKIEKEETCFSKQKDKKDGLRVNCKSCISSQYFNNIHEEKAKRKRYRTENKHKIKEYREKHKEEAKKQLKIYREKNKERLKKQRKEYLQTERGRDLVRASYKRQNQKRRSSIRGNLMIKLRRSVRRCVVDYYNGIPKRLKTLEYIGCDLDFFVNHIKSQFTNGMTEKDLIDGKIHIDHIKPLCSFPLNTEESIKEANNWSNLRPLWGADNLAKSMEDRKLSIKNECLDLI